jgi:hypothetical protein
MALNTPLAYLAHCSVSSAEQPSDRRHFVQLWSVCRVRLRARLRSRANEPIQLAKPDVSVYFFPLPFLLRQKPCCFAWRIYPALFFFLLFLHGTTLPVLRLLLDES